VIAPIRPFSSSDTLDRALQLFEEGQLCAAHRELHHVLSQDGDFGRAWELLGQIYHTWSQTDQAISCLERASSLVSLRASAMFALADCYAKTGQTELANEMLRYLQKRQDAPASLLLEVAAHWDLRGEMLPAIAACREAVRRDPDWALPYFDLSFYLGKSGAPPHIIEATARKAISLAPENPRFRVGLAGFLQTCGRECEAYALLAPVTLNHIQTMTCPCCLARLVAIFEAAGDRRADFCKLHAEQVSNWASQS